MWHYHVSIRQVAIMNFVQKTFVKFRQKLTFIMSWTRYHLHDIKRGIFGYEERKNGCWGPKNGFIRTFKYKRVSTNY